MKFQAAEQEEDEEGDLWDIEYDDGDTETFALKELKEAIELYRSSQGKEVTEQEAKHAFYSD